MEFVLTNCVSPYCSLSKLQKTVRLSPPLLCICSVFIHYCLIFSCEIFFGLHFFYSLFWWTHRMYLILQPNVNRTSITQCMNSKEKKTFNSSIFFSHSSTLIWHLLLIFLTADLNKLTISTNYSVLQLNGLSAGTCKFYTLFFTPYKSKNKQKKKNNQYFYYSLLLCVTKEAPPGAHSGRVRSGGWMWNKWNRRNGGQGVSKPSRSRRWWRGWADWSPTKESVSCPQSEFSSGAVKQEPAEGNKAALLIKSEHQHSSQKII